MEKNEKYWLVTMSGYCPGAASVIITMPLKLPGDYTPVDSFVETSFQLIDGFIATALISFFEIEKHHFDKMSKK
jgi:hypothetical protein